MAEIPWQRHAAMMDRAIALAREAGELGEIPVGAVVVAPDGAPLAAGANCRERDADPLGHAELVAIARAAKHLGHWHLAGCTLYVTLEPCPMCAGAIVQARLQTLVYGADDPKAGAVRTVLNIPDSPAAFHRLEVIGGVRERECRDLLQAWFQQRRSQL